MTSQVRDIPSPQVGFNNNVKHRGRVFHIQTEDSGVARPHIITHLFVDGGLIIKSTKTEYADVVDSPDLPTVLRKRMKEQHKAMFIDLREGRLDAVIDEVLGATKDKPSRVRKSTAPQARKARSKPPSRRRSRAPEQAAKVRSQPPSTMHEQAPVVPLAQRPASSASGRYGATRPSAAFSAPDSSSIFGNSSISEQSLDDVILSYISADLDGNAKTGE